MAPLFAGEKHSQILFCHSLISNGYKLMSNNIQCSSKRRKHLNRGTGEETFPLVYATRRKVSFSRKSHRLERFGWNTFASEFHVHVEQTLLHLRIFEPLHRFFVYLLESLQKVFICREYSSSREPESARLGI